jgi:hypothetical protein
MSFDLRQEDKDSFLFKIARTQTSDDEMKIIKEL